MMKNYINKEYYRNIVGKFKQETMSLWKCGYPWGPFIPYVFSKYMQSNKKYFYVGRDTYYWSEIENFIHNDVDTYMELNASCVDDQSAQEFGYGSFFFFIIQLHIRLLKGHTIESIDDLSSEDAELLKSIGYGNLNAIELPRSLQNEGYWDGINDYDGYNKMRESGHQLEKIKDILEAYHPDCIFIFNWEERDDIFEGLDVVWRKEFYQDGIIAEYDIKGYSTKVIWCSHPTRLKFLGMNNYDMIDLIVDTYDRCMETR